MLFSNPFPKPFWKFLNANLCSKVRFGSDFETQLEPSWHKNANQNPPGGSKRLRGFPPERTFWRPGSRNRRQGYPRIDFGSILHGSERQFGSNGTLFGLKRHPFWLQTAPFWLPASSPKCVSTFPVFPCFTYRNWRSVISFNWKNDQWDAAHLFCFYIKDCLQYFHVLPFEIGVL